MDPATTTHDLPAVAGGAGLSSLHRTASTSYLGAFFLVDGPLIHRLAQIRGTTPSRATALLEDPAAAKELG